ncbi:MAG: methylmalonyl-CoA mutase family protein, partial [Gemmatimonadota bacterium]|nr:methylmalonyl-CoA mutase family protein [Gemmatimonadota bacterium]
KMGGALAAIEAGFQQREIEEAAYRHQMAVESGDARVVGVNVHEESDLGNAPALFEVDPGAESAQCRALQARKAARDPVAVEEALRAVKDAASGEGPVVESIVEAVRVEAGLGEICHALRDVWGVYRPGSGS